MTDNEDRPQQPDAQTTHTTLEGDEADVEGHSMLLYEQARTHARDRSREADEWSRKEALRRQAQERKPERR